MVHGEPVGYPIPLLQKGLLKFQEAHDPQLRIESWGNAARILQIRGFNAENTISFDHTTNADRSVKQEDFDLADTPIMLQCRPAAAGVKRGECYVRATLMFGGFPVTCLFQGYVGDDLYPCFPMGPNYGPTEGPGRIYSVTTTDPAAGAAIAHTVPDNVRWRILAAVLRLVTDATAANRTVSVELQSATNTLWRGDAAVVQTASLTRDYFFTPGLPVNPAAFDSGNGLAVRLPTYPMMIGGDTIAFTALNLQVGDNFGAAEILVEEWIEE
jgi:hypothetical protein